MEKSDDILTIQIHKDIIGPITDYYNKYRNRCYRTKLNTREKAKFKIALDPVIEPIPLKVEDYSIGSIGEILIIQIPKDLLLTMFDYYNRYKLKCYRDKLNSREKAKYKTVLDPVIEPIPIKIEDFPHNITYAPLSIQINALSVQPSTQILPSAQPLIFPLTQSNPSRSHSISIPLSFPLSPTFPSSSSLSNNPTFSSNPTLNPLAPTLNPPTQINQLSFKLS